jgi:hypothetical protein
MDAGLVTSITTGIVKLLRGKIAPLNLVIEDDTLEKPLFCNFCWPNISTKVPGSMNDFFFLEILVG